MDEQRRILGPSPSSHAFSKRASVLGNLDCSKMIAPNFNSTADITSDNMTRRSFCTSDGVSFKKNITNTLRKKDELHKQFVNKNPSLDFKVLQRRPPKSSIMFQDNKNQQNEEIQFFSYYDFSTKKLDFKEAILQNNTMRELFYQFVKSEHSDENLEFYMEIENHKKSNLIGDKLKEKSKFIYEEYLKNGSPKMINVDYITSKQIQDRLPRPTLEMFDTAQKQVINLMQSDSLGRFLSSDIYKEMVEFPYLYFDTVISMVVNQSEEKSSKVQRFFEKIKPKSSNNGLNKKYQSNKTLFIMPDSTSYEEYDNKINSKAIRIYSSRKTYTYVPKPKKTLKNALQFVLPKGQVNKNLRCFRLPFITMIDLDSETTTLNGQTLMTRVYSNFKLVVGEEITSVYDVYAPSDDIIGNILTTIEDLIGVKVKESVFYQAPNITICLGDPTFMYQGWTIQVETIDSQCS